MTPWGEFVHVTATIFKAGEYPWTKMDFCLNSKPQSIAPHTTDPIVINFSDKDDLFNDEPLVAERDDWWLNCGDLWSAPVILDDDLKLIHEVMRFDLIPMSHIAGDKEIPPIGLIAGECCDLSTREIFEPFAYDLTKAAYETRRYMNRFTNIAYTHVSFLTLWECDTGKDEDNWTGPGEYWTKMRLVGFIEPLPNTVVFRTL